MILKIFRYVQHKCSNFESSLCAGPIWPMRSNLKKTNPACNKTSLDLVDQFTLQRHMRPYYQGQNQDRIWTSLSSAWLEYFGSILMLGTISMTSVQLKGRSPSHNSCYFLDKQWNQMTRHRFHCCF